MKFLSKLNNKIFGIYTGVTIGTICSISLLYKGMGYLFSIEFCLFNKCLIICFWRYKIDE